MAQRRRCSFNHELPKPNSYCPECLGWRDAGELYRAFLFDLGILTTQVHAMKVIVNPHTMEPLYYAAQSRPGEPWRQWIIADIVLELPPLDQAELASHMQSTQTTY